MPAASSATTHLLCLMYQCRFLGSPVVSRPFQLVRLTRAPLLAVLRNVGEQGQTATTMFSAMAPLCQVSCQSRLRDSPLESQISRLAPITPVPLPMAEHNAGAMVTSVGWVEIPSTAQYLLKSRAFTAVLQPYPLVGVTAALLLMAEPNAGVTIPVANSAMVPGIIQPAPSRLQASRAELPTSVLALAPPVPSSMIPSNAGGAMSICPEM